MKIENIQGDLREVQTKTKYRQLTHTTRWIIKYAHYSYHVLFTWLCLQLMYIHHLMRTIFPSLTWFWNKTNNVYPYNINKPASFYFDEIKHKNIATTNIIALVYILFACW